MTLALFDLDNTLLNGDSDYEWGQFMGHKGLVDAPSYTKKNIEFYEQYMQGTLDIYEFARFSLTPLTEHDPDTLNKLHEEYMETVVRPRMTPKAVELVEHHRALGHTLIIITATNSFVTKPIATAFGIEHLLATDPKIVNGRYTNEVEGTPCFKEGKVTRLNQWLAHHPEESLAGSYFYSDSHNDLPLLHMVDYPYTVNPDPQLEAVALAKGWPILDIHSAS